MPLRDRPQGGYAEREQQEVECPGARPALCVLYKIRAKSPLTATDAKRASGSSASVNIASLIKLSWLGLG